VTISGTVSGNSFRRDATLRLVPTIAAVGTTNGVNSTDVCLISGVPAGRPEVGAIWLGSNSGCDPDASAADIDLAFVTVDGNTFTVKPDERVAATAGHNVTSSSDYIWACLYIPVSGRLRVTIGDNGSVRGSVEVTGYGGASCGNSAYQATISG
jgi:hypothetical protein